MEICRERRKSVIDPNFAQAKLQHIRNLLAIQHEPEMIRRLTTLEAKIRAIDRRGAIAWRRSRVWWLAVGDAPSFCFFAQMRAKLSNKTMRSIKKEDGYVIENEDILRYIDMFYTKKIAKDIQLATNVEDHRRSLALITNNLLACERETPDKVLDMDEVEKVLETFNIGKSPRLDGLTIEVLRSC